VNNSLQFIDNVLAHIHLIVLINTEMLTSNYATHQSISTVSHKSSTQNSWW